MLKRGDKVVVSKVRKCQTILSKAIGLMFSRKIKDECLIFYLDTPARVDLHMFFVFFPIDVLFLDEKRHVVEMKEDFRPFTVFMPFSKAKYVIELPARTIESHSIKVGDRLDF